MKNHKMLLKEFYEKKCTGDETRMVYRWLSDPANKEEVSEVLSQMWEETNAEEPAMVVDFEGILANILEKTGLRRASIEERNGRYRQATSGSLSGVRSNHRPRPFSAYRIAAGLVSILVISVLTFKLFFEDKYFIYSTAFGETKVITLPDGSDVTLNSNTTIKYAYNFDESSENNDAPREVFLDGEGFFNVKKREGSKASGVKFIVHANEVDVEVLGTSFNVNTRRGKTMVVLNSGRVRLGIEESGNRMKEMIMSPGELVEVGNKEKAFVKRTVDAVSYSAWRQNKLIFGNTPVRDILNLIEDNFGYEVVLHDKTLENRFYTDTTPADDLDLLLSKLSIVYNLKVTRTDTQIVIQAKN